MSVVSEHEPALLLLVGELQHRVANSFTIIVGLVARDATHARDPGVRDALMKAEAQIRAFALVHDLLSSRNAKGGVVCGTQYLTRLCAHLKAACLTSNGIALALDLEPQPLHASTCETLGLIVAKLVINAAKQAVDMQPAGEVRVASARPADGWAVTVADNDCGMPVLSATARQGLGLVKLLAVQIGASLMCRTGDDGTSVAVILLATALA